MTKKIYVSPSDQTENIYAAGNTNEAVQCQAIAKLLCKALERCGFETKTDYTLGGQAMNNRIAQSNEWGADLHVPIHTNAFNGQLKGTRLFCYDLVGEGFKASKAILSRLAPVVPGDSDGVATANFAEIKRTNCPCAYVEAAFHDNKEQAQWIIDNKKQIAEAICQGVCDYFSVKYVPEAEPKPEPAKKTLYRVQVGAYEDKKNAEAMVEYLDRIGVAGHIVEVK